MSEPELQELADDLKRTNGPLEKITLYEEKILDGRNRYLASQRAGVLLEPSHFVQFKGNRDEAAAFVISRNILRRHLTPDQRSAIAAALYAQLPKRGPGQPKKVLSPDSDNSFPGADAEAEVDHDGQREDGRAGQRDLESSRLARSHHSRAGDNLSRFFAPPGLKCPSRKSVHQFCGTVTLNPLSEG